jgi:signal transduction histidine kinase
MLARIRLRVVFGFAIGCGAAVQWYAAAIGDPEPTMPYRARCTVILQTRPDRLYCYATNRPFRVVMREPARFAHGEELIAESREFGTNFTEMIPTLLNANVRRLGLTNLPPPIDVTPGQLAANQHNYCRVRIKGRVVSHEGSSFLGRRIAVVVVQGVDREFRLEVLNNSDVRSRLPVDSEIEVVGLSFVETSAGSPEPEVQVDIEDIEECRIVRQASWLTLQVARRLVAFGAALAILGTLWFIRERRQIVRLLAAERAVRQLNSELEDRITQRTAELSDANVRLRDEVTARRHAEDGLRVALATEREVNELKSRFVSTVSHEFRTPLGTIMSSAEILEAYLDRLSTDERKDHLRDIFDATRHMGVMVEEVLVLGRIEAGKMIFRPGRVDIAGFCIRVADEVASATHGRCPIACAAAPDLPPAWADEGLMRHIFINLLTNAVKYSPPGSAVEFRAEASGACAAFVVRDRGIGIPEADGRQLYTAFHRGGNVGDTPGSGLGMTIVKSCVDLHRGQIDFLSREDEGTTFTVTLPVFQNGAGGEPEDRGSEAAEPI